MKRTRCGRGNRTIGGAFVQFGCHTGRCVPSTFVYRLNYVRHLSQSSDEGRRLNARAAREHSAGTWRLIGASLIEQEPNAEGLFVHISRTLRLKCEHKKKMHVVVVVFTSLALNLGARSATVASTPNTPLPRDCVWRMCRVSIEIFVKKQTNKQQCCFFYGHAGSRYKYF